MKENFAKALVDAPGHLFGYVIGLIIALLGDYTLITLTIFVVLLGLLTGSILIAATTFFGLFFVFRLVVYLSDGLRYHADLNRLSGNQQAQATMQVAAALAQFHPPQEQSAPDA
jgi:hypothetical protein